ncbi:MAG TPA: DinB family protein [Dehalococcoidia bacterium]|jgi:uncharacterized damage-inducible protein DinB|nr:DinB family protein [Dehalococcoidia bacterium]
MPATRTRVELLAQLLESAFRGRTAHSLLANLSDVRDADWDARPAGGDRTIGEIVEHCTIAAELWHDTLLASEQRTYDALFAERPRAAGPDPAALREALIAAHDHFLASMRSFDDAQLADARRAHYGALTSVERAIVVLIEHALFHAGEIGVIRGVVESETR